MTESLRDSARRGWPCRQAPPAADQRAQCFPPNRAKPGTRPGPENGANVSPDLCESTSWPPIRCSSGVRPLPQLDDTDIVVPFPAQQDLGGTALVLLDI